MTHIGLLRAVNLAGHNTVSMGALRDLLASVGMQNVRTLLQSGNAVFDSAVSPSEKLEALLERATAKQLGVNTEFFVRSVNEWKAIIAGNPFPQEAKADPARLVIVCLKKPVDRAAVAALQSAISGRETLRAKGREAYIIYPDGMGRSKLTTALIEKHLGCRGTARNWNTVLKLAAAAGAGER